MENMEFGNIAMEMPCLCQKTAWQIITCVTIVSLSEPDIKGKSNQEAEPVTEQICLLKLAEPLSILKTYDLSDARW